MESGGFILFPGELLTTVKHIAFGHKFGPLFGDVGDIALQETVRCYTHPNHPQIYRVFN